MLYELYAENFALMTSMHLQLGGGMNALTGETGAGKSLVIDALSLLLGARGGDNMIRSGYDRCLIEGTFLPPFPRQSLDLLADNGFTAEDDLILSRELVRGGRSVARVNGRTVTVSFLRELGRTLVNLHGQRDHMLLLEESYQQLLLDSAVDDEKSLAAVKDAYQRMRAAEKKIKERERDIEKNTARLEELHYLIDELEAADLKPEEDKELGEEAALLAHGEKLYQTANDGIAALAESMEGISSALSSLKTIASLDKNADEMRERQQSLFYEAEDLSRELADYRDRIDLDAYRLEEIEARLALLSKLKKKYYCTLEELIEKLAAAKKEASDIEELSFSAAELQSALDQARADYDTAAAVITEKRQITAAKLSKALTRELELLCMPEAELRVDLVPNEASDIGREHATFMVRTNVGEDFQPMAKIASGGELSRIELAVKVTLSKSDYVPTMIFDEVDTGLSGKALVSVAQRIATVGESSQAVVVTHNAVMAAAAAHQILIEKHQEDQRTVSAAHMLTETERVEEIARMIAGNKAGEVTYEQAREMLEKMSQPQLF